MINVECKYVGNIDDGEVVCLKLYIRKLSLNSYNACFREVFSFLIFTCFSSHVIRSLTGCSEATGKGAVRRFEDHICCIPVKLYTILRNS